MFPDWARLFPLKDHRFQMGLRPGDAQAFWAAQDATGEISRERQRWLRHDPALYVAELPEGRLILEEALRWMQQWSSVGEADWVVLSGDEGEESIVLGGEVVFPSSWSLPEKLGLPLSDVHAPVPGLETTLGKSIQTFLNRIEPKAAWERDNWGLSADAELNHHPSRVLPSLEESAQMRSTWIRLERQFLTRLPRTRGLLFGIRVSCHRLDEAAAIPGVADGLTKTLESLSDDVARYKGLLTARDPLLRELRERP